MKGLAEGSAFVCFMVFFAEMQLMGRFFAMWQSFAIAGGLMILSAAYIFISKSFDRTCRVFIQVAMAAFYGEVNLLCCHIHTLGKALVILGGDMLLLLSLLLVVFAIRRVKSRDGSA